MSNSSVMGTLAAVVKVGPGVVRRVCGSGAVISQFVQIHDSATIPVAGAVPAAVFELATANFNFQFDGLLLSNGIVVLVSTQPFIYAVPPNNAYEIGFTAEFD